MILPGSTPESRRHLIEDNVHTFFPTYESIPDSIFSILEEHIQTHGYFLQREHNVAISESECFTSWSEYVLDPILTGISIQHRKTNSSIDPLQEYIAISQLWFSYAKKQSFYNLENLGSVLKDFY